MSGKASNLILGVATAVAIFIAGTSRAGDWHVKSSTQCSDCHTQHNSANGQPMRTDENPTPAPMLLRRGTPLELCLSCHDGSNPSAPDVLAPVSYIDNPAGGLFPNAGGFPVDEATSIGHHLNTPSPVVPPGGTQAMVLTCTTCHDPHGNDNYRNLRPDPTGSSGPGVTFAASQSTKANGTNPADVYGTYRSDGKPNVIYESGVSAWCTTCHASSVHATSDHPIDKAIFGSAGAVYTNWLSITLPRVPVTTASATVPSTDNFVNCLSCHKAHGSNNPHATIYADGTTLNSTCQECHNQ